MLIMYVVWKLVKKTKIVKLSEMDLETDVYVADEVKPRKQGHIGRLKSIATWFI